MLSKHKSIVEITLNQIPSNEVAVKNRIELLSVLSRSILREIEAMQHDGTISIKAEIDLAIEVQRFEADLIRGALIRANGKQRHAARLLNLKTTTLHNKMKRYGISNNGFSS